MRSDPIQRVRELKEEYEVRSREIINPEGYDWEDLGQDGPVPGYDTVESYIFLHEDFDEGQQKEIRMIQELVEKLEEILEGR